MSLGAIADAGPPGAAAVSDAVRAVARSVVDGVSTEVLLELLVAAGRLPHQAHGAASDAQSVLVTARAHCATLLEELLDLALLEAVAEDDERLAEVRRFLLEPQDSYSLNELARLWRLSTDDAADVCHDEITRWESAAGDGSSPSFRLPWAEALGTAVTFSLIRPHEIERALGEGFLQVRSDRWKTVPVLIRLPRFVAEAFSLDAAIPQKLALAHRIEQILLELFSQENRTADCTGGGSQ